jgi:histidinol-phosphate phosphatase family protein
MKRPAVILKLYSMNSEWTLFLDRDGVINTEPPDYVKKWSEFRFEPGALQALHILNPLFGRIIIITNQRGIGRGLMSEQDLSDIHQRMTSDIIRAGGRIDDIYYCPDKDRESPRRKPNPYMVLEARKKYPSIDFSRSVMVGNNITDMQMGRAAGLLNVFVDDKKMHHGIKEPETDLIFPDLLSFAQFWKENHGNKKTAL